MLTIVIPIHVRTTVQVKNVCNVQAIVKVVFPNRANERQQLAVGLQKLAKRLDRALAEHGIGQIKARKIVIWADSSHDSRRTPIRTQRRHEVLAVSICVGTESIPY
jgi:hypothetical protein